MNSVIFIMHLCRDGCEIGIAHRWAMTLSVGFGIFFKTETSPLAPSFKN